MQHNTWHINDTRRLVRGLNAKTKCMIHLADFVVAENEPNFLK